MIGEESDGAAYLFGSGSPSTSVQEDLAVAGVVVVDNEVDFRNIKTSRSHICYHQETVLLPPETVKR